MAEELSQAPTEAGEPSQAPTGGEEPSQAPLEEHQRAFDKIWWQMPERQNRTSTSWWFFLLFPEGEDGYGPRQLMYSVAACVGDDNCGVNGITAPGMDLNRPIQNGTDEFDAISVGWYGDGEDVYDYMINQPSTVTLDRDGQSLAAWANDEDNPRGSEIRACPDRLGLEAEFVGQKASGEFRAWGDLDSRVNSPEESSDIESILGGTHMVAWRRMNFEGEFDLPTGREHLEGLCYFQRVCVNVPLFPWKWVWAYFPDGTAFSVMIPFAGPQLFRRGLKYFSSNKLERISVPIQQTGLWDWADSEGSVEFDSATVTPNVHKGEHPDFTVRAENDDGDYVSFDAGTYGHARNYLERPVFGSKKAHWSYNEYMFRMANLEGSIDGQLIDRETVGQGFGTLEYAWGLG